MQPLKVAARELLLLSETLPGKKLTEKGTIIETVVVANIVPPMLAPNPSMYSGIPEYNHGDDSKEANKGTSPGKWNSQMNEVTNYSVNLI